MAKSSLAIIGKNRLAEELFELCQAKGLAGTIHADAEAISGSPSLLVETRAGPEEEKKEIIKKIDAGFSSSVILTSCVGFSTTRIASWTARPERVAGFASFYPIKAKKLIELTGGLRTQERPLKEAENFFQALGKETARVKDEPGLVFPRILSLIINEAVRSLDEGVAQAEEIDLAMRLGVNYPSGPLRWGDQVGLDEVLAVLEGLHRDTGDDRYRPAPLLRRMVLAGWLGESRGRGFYNYKDSQGVT